MSAPYKRPYIKVMFTSTASKRTRWKTHGLFHRKYELSFFLTWSFNTKYVKVKRQRDGLHRATTNPTPCTGPFLPMWNADPMEMMCRREGSETDRVWAMEITYLKHSVELTIDVTTTAHNTDVHYNVV